MNIKQIGKILLMIIVLVGLISLVLMLVVITGDAMNGFVMAALLIVFTLLLYPERLK